MEIKAKLKHLRIAPRKVRLVADLIRGKMADDASKILEFTIKKGAHPMKNLLMQAIANAKNNFQIEADNLYISKVFVDEGSKLKRWMPRSRGTAMEIQKKLCHITMVLEEKEISGKEKGEKKIKENKSPEEQKEEEKKESKVKKSSAKTKISKTKNDSKMNRGKIGLKRVFKRKSI